MALDSHTHLFVPGAPGDGRTLLLLHGTGGDERSMLGLGELLAPAAAKLSVRGNVSEQGAARFFRRLAPGVYDMDDLERRTRELAAFIEAAVEAHGLTRAGLIGIGYSNGANILANLLFERPDLVRRAVLLHPLIPFTPPANEGLRGADILITGGERDPMSPLPMTEALAAWFRANGAAVGLHLHPGGHEVAEDELAAARRFVAATAGAGPDEAGSPA